MHAVTKQDEMIGVRSEFNMHVVSVSLSSCLITVAQENIKMYNV